MPTTLIAVATWNSDPGAVAAVAIMMLALCATLAWVAVGDARSAREDAARRRAAEATRSRHAKRAITGEGQ